MHGEAFRGNSENPASEWVQRTALYQRSERIREEINRHKWYESEKAGHDIGWSRAATSWLVRHGGEPDA